jgi:hypothetical protein
LGLFRIDRGRDDLDALNRKVGRYEPAQREHGRVVGGQERAHEAPHRGVRLRGVDVAPPHPARRPPAVKLRGRERLRVVDDDDVVLLFKQLGVAGRMPEIGPLVGVGQHPLRTLQRVVHRLRDREKLLVAGDELPVRYETEIAEQRDRRPQDLGHTAAVRRCVDVKHPGALQRRGECLDHLDGFITCARAVVVDRRPLAFASVAVRLATRLTQGRVAPSVCLTTGGQFG